MRARKMIRTQSRRNPMQVLVKVLKNKVTLPITCTSAYLDVYEIVDDDDDDVHGKTLH